MSYSQRFNVINMIEYDVILRRDWLQLINSLINWLMFFWQYHSERKLKIKITNSRQFSKISRNIMLYLMYANRVNDFSKTRSQKDAIEKLNLFALYRDFVRVFFFKNSEVLLSKKRHKIDLIDNKQFSYHSFYSMFTKKLDELRKYLKKM